MIQGHYTYCALYFCYYDISSTSDHQVLDPRDHWFHEGKTMRWLVNFYSELATFYIPILLWKILSATFLLELLMYKFIWKILIMLTHVTFNFFLKEIIQNNILIPNSTAQDKRILHYILLTRPSVQKYYRSWTAGLNVFLMITPSAWVPAFRPPPWSWPWSII